MISTSIDRAIAMLNNEDVVAIPTETVYGLAGDIYSEKAIRKIFDLKKRPLFNPLIVHTYSYDQLSEIVDHIPEKAKILAEAFWPGPMTLILKKKPNIPDLVTAGKDTVGVRVPNHPVTLQLLEKLNFPLAAPSANPFGSISPTSAYHVESYFRDKLSMVLEGGECKNGIESTIIGFINDEPVVYRLGSISLEEIEIVVGHIDIKNKKEIAPDAPGMLARHYAPKTRTYLVNNILEFIEDWSDNKVGVLVFKEGLSAPNIKHVEILSNTGELKEAASNLYAALHRLDGLDLDIIVAQRLPDHGLGKSINDRLERATKTA